MLGGKFFKKINETDSYKLALLSSWELYFIVNRAGVEQVFFSEARMVLDRWSHVAVERRGENLRFYIDGLPEETAASISGKIGDNEAWLAFGTDFQGRLDEVRFSKAALGAKLLRTVTKYTYNARNQLTTEKMDRIHKTYSYDKNGNTVGIVEHVNKNGQLVSTNQTEMTYDKFNRMTSWSKSPIAPSTGMPMPTAAATETTTYRGAEWHRTSTTANGNKVSYLYDGDNVVADYGSTSTTAGGPQNRTAFYVTPGLDENLSLTTASGGTYYYSHDGLGSVRTLTTSNGSLTNTYDYTPFGAPIAQGNPGEVTQRYTYTGRESSPHATAPMYFRYRHVWNNLGRFQQRAPEDVYNRYQGHFFPNKKDPFGLPTESYGFTVVTPDGETIPYSFESKLAAQRHRAKLYFLRNADYAISDIRRFAENGAMIPRQLGRHRRRPDRRTGCCVTNVMRVSSDSKAAGVEIRNFTARWSSYSLTKQRITITVRGDEEIDPNSLVKTKRAMRAHQSCINSAYADFADKAGRELIEGTVLSIFIELGPTVVNPKNVREVRKQTPNKLYKHTRKAGSAALRAVGKIPALYAFYRAYDKVSSLDEMANSRQKACPPLPRSLVVRCKHSKDGHYAIPIRWSTINE